MFSSLARRLAVATVALLFAAFIAAGCDAPFPIAGSIAGGADSVGSSRPSVVVGGFVRSGFVGRPVGTGAMRTYRVEVEPETGLDPNDVAAEVASILGDPRSWIADASVAFQQVPDDDASIVIRVARPSTVDRLCAPLGTRGQLSCRSGRYVNLNLDRWLGATSFWPSDLGTYRAYLINHEVGHALGHGHVGCPGAGALAPVMMQQTKGLGTCQANGWPYP